MEIPAEHVLSPDSEYRHGTTTTTASLFHKYLDGAEAALPLGEARNDATEDGELDDEDVLLALLIHRHEHDASFARALSESHPHRLLYLESRRGRRRWGVDARRKQGGNGYGALLMAVREAFREVE